MKYVNLTSRSSTTWLDLCKGKSENPRQSIMVLSYLAGQIVFCFQISHSAWFGVLALFP